VIPAVNPYTADRSRVIAYDAFVKVFVRTNDGFTFELSYAANWTFRFEMGRILTLHTTFEAGRDWRYA
jgi:hypothetical protein